MTRIGVDLGGTKIEAIALDDAGRTLARERVATPRDDYDATLTAIATLVERVESQVGAHGSIGIGMPGAISMTTGLVKNANSTWLNGRSFVDDVEATLGRAVRVANDANCFALSEAVDGAGVGHRVVFGVILGTGVGGGIAIDRVIHVGRNAIAGEWGHDALPRVEDVDLPAPRCYCGRSGCIETYLSGPALVADQGTNVDVAAIVHDALQGAPDARRTLARYVRRLAKSLASVINLLDPDVIVLGGGLSNIDALYDEVPRLLPEFVFSDAVTTPIVRNRHGDSSGVRGAAWLWPLATR